MIIEKVQGLIMSIVLLLFLTGLSIYIVLMLYPFYTWETPFKVNGGRAYGPGDYVHLSTHRDSRITTVVDAFRELVRVDEDGKEFEVEKVRYTVGFDRGEKSVVFYFKLPDYCEIMEDGMYRYTGTATYRVFGVVQRTVPFHTELFKVQGCMPDDEANDENNDNQIGPAKVAE